MSIVFDDEAANKIILEREKEYSISEDLNIFVVTWNMGGYNPPNFIDLSNLFNFQNNPIPDVVVFCLQEYIELNAANVALGGLADPRIAVWKDILYTNLRKIDNFVYVRHQNLVGILTFIFAKDAIKQRISRVESDVVKTGLKGNFGNKGGTVIKLYIDDTSFVFMNCHLEAGNKSNNTRLQNIIDIHQKAFQQEGVGRKRVYFTF